MSQKRKTGKRAAQSEKSRQPCAARLNPVTSFIRTALPAGLLFGLSAGNVAANPEGGVVVSGNGNFVVDGTTYNINQLSPSLIAHFQSFNINVNEIVNINQKTSDQFLARIFDQNPSQIFGQLNAQGHVTLLNSNGLFISPTATVSVGSIIASSLDISDEDFMNGNHVFFNKDGSEGGQVVNQGLIQAATGGSVSLVGGAVKNEGTIIATAGQVNLVAGKKVTMDFDGDGLMQFTVDEEILENVHDLDNAVSNTGQIIAEGGTVLLKGSAAKDVFTHVVNNEGMIRAGRIENKGGVIKLVAGGTSNSLINTGTVDATGIGGDGGIIEIYASENVTITGDSVITASASSADGSVISVIDGVASIDDYSSSTGIDANVSKGDVVVVSHTSDSDTNLNSITSDSDITITASSNVTTIAGISSIVDTTETETGANITSSSTTISTNSLLTGTITSTDTLTASVNETISIEGTTSIGESGTTSVSTETVANLTIETPVINEANATPDISITATPTPSEASSETITLNGAIAVAGYEAASSEDGGKIKIEAGDVLEVSGNSEITASSDNGNGGEIDLLGETVLLEVNSLIAATSNAGKGGTVHALGDKVGLFDYSNIDVSGQKGGGVALIGGDYQGKNENIRNATYTYVGENVSINADAITEGDGGKVIVWADDAARVHGTITARGGSESGDGGFVETSGKIYLDVAGSNVSASAANGEVGTWLLDPNNIEIIAGAGNTNINNATPFVSTNDTAQLGVDLITTALNAGTSVDVTTASAGTNGEAGNITVSTAITKTAGGAATLTLTALNDIIINAGISSTVGALGLTLSATGNVDINATIDTNGGAFSSTGVNFDNTGGTISTGAGSLTINQTGNVTLAAAIDSTTGAIDIDAGGTLDISAGITTATSGTIDIDATGLTTITASGDISSGGTVIFGASKTGLLTTAGDITTTNDNITFTRATTLSGGVTLDTGNGAGNILFSDTLTGPFDLDINAGSGTATFTGAVSNLGDGIGAAINIQNTSTGLVTFQNTVGTNSSMTAGNATSVQFNENVTLGDGNLSSSFGALTLDGLTWSSFDGFTVNGNLTLSSAAVSLNANGGQISLFTLAGGTQDLTITGTISDMSVSGAVTALGDGVGAALTVDNTVTGAIEFLSTVAANSGIVAGAATDLKFEGDVTLGNGDTATSLGTVELDGLNWSSFDGVSFGATTLSTAAVAINSNGSVITFSNTLNGAQNLTLTAGAGNIDFDGVVGGTTDLLDVSIVSAGNVTADLAFDAESITQTTGTGTTTFTGALSTTGTNGTHGIQITTTGVGGIAFGNTVNTNGQSVSLAAGAISLASTLTATGSTVTLTSDNAADTIGVEDSGQALNFTDATLDLITASTVVIGDAANTGGISIADDAAVSQNKNLSFRTQGNIALVDQAISTTNAGTLTFDGSGAAGAITIGALADINAAGAVSFTSGSGNISTAGDIVTSDDNITFNQAVTLSGDVDIDTGTGAGNILFSSTVGTGGNDLTLDGGAAGNVTITGAVTGGGDMTVRDGAVQSYDALTVNLLNIQDATTSVTLGGAVAATTTIDIDSQGGSIVQNGAITSATNVDLDAASTIGINAGITASGTVDIDSTGVTTVAAAGDIDAGGAVTFGAAKTGTLTTSGDIDTTDDNITFTRAVTLGGNVDIDTTGTAAGNILFSSTVDTGGNNLDLDGGAAGNVTISGAVTNGGDMTVRDGAVQSYDALTVNLLNIQDATTSVTLGGAVAATTTIDIDSGGTIVQNGAITSATNVDLDAGTTIGLNAAISGVSGTLDVDSTGVTTVAAAADISTGGAVTFGAAKTGTLTTSGDIDTTDDNITFTRAVTLGGNVDIDTTGTAAGNILFSSTVATGGNNLTLDGGAAGNVTLSAALTGGGDMTVRDSLNTNLNAVTAGSISITAQNDVTAVQDGATTNQDITVTTGALTINAGNDIILQDATGADRRTRLVATATGTSLVLNFSDIQIQNNDTTTAAQIVTNDLTLDPGAGNTVALGTDATTAVVASLELDDNELNQISATTITIGDTDIGAVTLDMTGSYTASSGNLAIITGSTINDAIAGTAFSSTGTLTLTSGSNIGNAGGGADGLTTDVNVFTVNSSGGNNVTVTDTGAGGDTTYNVATGGAGNITLTQTTNNLIAGNISTTGTVDVNSTAAAISQTGTITAGTLTGSAGTTVTLNGNNVITNLGAFTSNGAFSLNDSAGGLTLTGSVTTSGTGSASITTTGGALALGTNNVTGVGVSLTGTGVTSSAGSTVNGGTGDILIDGNGGVINLAGDLTTTSVSGTATTIRDATTVSLGNVTVGTGATGTVILGVGGDITGAVTQTGIITANTLTGNTANTVTLNGNNVITNLGAFTSNGAFSLNDNAGGLNVTGALDNTTGTVNVSTSGGTLDIGANIDSTGFGLTLTGVGVSQSAGTVLSSTATVNAGAGNISLNQTTNDFTGAVSLNSTGASVVVQDTNSIDLGASTVSGSLDVTANGAITDSGTVTVAGTTTLAAGAGNDITLDEAASNYSTVAITSGRDVAITDANALDLGASTVSGALTVTATAGDITDSGNVSVTNAATFNANAAGANIILDSAGNTFNGTVDFNSTGGLNNVTIVDTTALDLQATTVGGALNVTTSAGDITDSGNITVTNAATFNANGAGSNIILDSAGNTFNGAVNFTSTGGLNNLTIVDTTAFVLQTLTLTGAFNITAATSITATDVTITADTVNFATAATPLTLSGDNVFVTNSGGITFPTTVNMTAADSLAITVPDGQDLTIGTGGQNITSLLAGTVDGHLIFGGTVANGTDPFYNDTIDVDTATMTIGSDLTRTGNGSMTFLAGDVLLNGDITVPNGTIGIGANGELGGTTGTIETNGAIRTLDSQGTTAGADVANIVLVADSSIDSLDIVLTTGGEEVDVAVGLGGRIEFNELSNSSDVDTDALFDDSINGGFLTDAGFTAGVTFSFSLNPASNLIGLETLAFIDVGLFEEELTLFGQIGSGMALSLAQCEESEGCAPSISEDEINYLIQSLEARLLELERRLAEESDANVRADLEELIEGFNEELKEFKSYRQELEDFFAEDDEEEVDEEMDDELEDDGFFDDTVPVTEVERLAKVLETVKARIEWLTGLKAKPEERARLGDVIGIELTQEALDQIIDAAKSEAVFIENQIKLLLEGTEARLDNQFGSPVFTAEARDYSSMQTLHYGSNLLTLNDEKIKLLANYY